MIVRSCAVCVGLSVSLCVAACSGTVPADLGVKNGRLAPCPSSPNCVSSRSVDREHAISPLSYSGPPQEAMVRLKAIVSRMKRVTVVADTGAYLHAEFRSALFRFVDDVEFYADEKTKVIEVRSAARLGHSDFGVNRKRIEEIEAAWNGDGK
jgi:uncharacterized protein (DUF1499 family)